MYNYNLYNFIFFHFQLKRSKEEMMATLFSTVSKIRYVKCLFFNCGTYHKPIYKLTIGSWKCTYSTITPRHHPPSGLTTPKCPVLYLLCPESIPLCKIFHKLKKTSDYFNVSLKQARKNMNFKQFYS